MTELKTYTLLRAYSATHMAASHIAQHRWEIACQLHCTHNAIKIEYILLKELLK